MNMELTQNERRARFIFKILIVIIVIFGSILITVSLQGASQKFSAQQCTDYAEINEADAYLR